MSSCWGRNIKISLFGESHGPGIGVTVHGLPAGHLLDEARIEAFMQRRAPGRLPWSTNRREADEVEILSGLFRGRTTGAPLCGLIRNHDQRPYDYKDKLSRPRPGHADLTAELRYQGFQDHRGGGHFSGRLTAPLTFAGAVCQQIIETKQIRTAAHILSIGGLSEASFSTVDLDDELIDRLSQEDFPTLDPALGLRMIERIRAARATGDSVGGVVEGTIIGLPAGLGNPLFEGVAARLASLLFGLPAVKGVDFGAGFAAADMLGSQHNDPMFFEGERIRQQTNHAGGTLGGITTGEALVFRAAFKPTPSIRKEQQTVDLHTGEEVLLATRGRHDPCVVPRAVPVVDAAAALFALDLLLDRGWAHDTKD